MRTNSSWFILLATTTTTLTLAACNDTEAPKPKAPTTVQAPAETPPQPIAAPAPPVTPPPVAPATTTKSEGTDTVANKKADVVEADKEGGDQPKSTLAAARKALSDGEHEHALKLAKQAVAKMPKSSAAWNTLGRAQLESGNHKAAIASFEKSIEINPKNSYAKNNLGLTLIYDKRYEDAVDALEDAVEMEPVEGYMWNNLGMAYEHLDRLDEARDAYRKGVEMDNDRAKESLARLTGVKSVITTARADTPTTTTDVKETGDSKMPATEPSGN
jgi:Flp pilus assembly protein TadD